MGLELGTSKSYDGVFQSPMVPLLGLESWLFPYSTEPLLK
jgi:hypothetical protein